MTTRARRLICLGAAALILSAQAPRLAARPAHAASPGASATAGTPLVGPSPPTGRRSKPRPPTPSGPEPLERRLAARLSSGCLRQAKVGLVVASLADGAIVFEHNGGLALAPASTMKVLTTAAALDKLGPEWRYETHFYSDG